MLALKIKVVADADGSDGGPAEGYQDVTITPATYAHKLNCPYPIGSGDRDEVLDYYIKIAL